MLDSINQCFISVNQWLKKFLALRSILLILLTIFPAYAQAGEYAAEFLRIGIGARALGMGGAYVALADDGTAAFWNPAGVATNHNLQVTFSYTPMFNGLAQHNYASASLKVAPQTNLAVSWIRLEVDKIPRFAPLQGSLFDRIRNPELRSTGEAEGYFGDTEQAFVFSVARALDFDFTLGGGFSPIILPARIAIGLNFKYIHQALDVAIGNGQGIDLGGLLEFHSSDTDANSGRTVAMGLVMKDIFKTTIAWNTPSKTRDTIPLNASFGVAYSETLPSLRGRLTLTFHREEGGGFGNWGGEYSFSDFLAFRTGLHNGRLTAGAGLRIYKLQIDYAFVGNDLGNTHRISGFLSF